MAKVSVIVPVYNTDKYLDKCLSSLVNQTLDDIEIIIVDDGSTDNSKSIIDKYLTDTRVKYVKKDNGGLSSARNYGLSYVTSDYIGYVDSDDYVSLTMYSNLYNKMISGNYDLVECDFIWEYPNNSRIDKTNIVEDYFLDIRVVAWNKLYKTSIIKDNKLEFLDGKLYEDISFCYKYLMYTNSIGYINDIGYYYIQRDGSITNKSSVRVREVYDILYDVLDYYKEKGLYKEYYAKLEYLCIKIVLGRSFYRICLLDDKKLRKAYLIEGYDFLESNFPKWRKNSYLIKRKDKKNIYYRCCNRIVYSLSSVVFRLLGNKLVK